MLAKHLLTLPSCRQAQDWQADLEREFGWGKTETCCNTSTPSPRSPHPMITPPLAQTTPESSIIISQPHLATWHLLTPFYCLFPVSQFSPLLKGSVSSESLALPLCAQGCRSLIKTFNKTHLSYNSYIMLTIWMTPLKEVPVFPYPLLILSELLPSPWQNSSLPVPMSSLLRGKKGEGGQKLWKLKQSPSVGASHHHHPPAHPRVCARLTQDHSRSGFCHYGAVWLWTKSPYLSDCQFLHLKSKATGFHNMWCVLLRCKTMNLVTMNLSW